MKRETEGCEGMQEPPEKRASLVDPVEGDVEGEVEDAAGRARRSMRSRQDHLTLSANRRFFLQALSAGKGNARGATKSEVMPSINYIEGEPLKGLKKYLGSNDEGQAVEVRLPPSAMSRSNSQVRARQLWGADIYTDDSDLVAVLMHTGYYANPLASPPSTVKEFRAVVRPVQAKVGFVGESRNNIRSRAWGGVGSGCGYRVEGCSIITKSGTCIPLDPSSSNQPSVIPTFIPAATERVVNTRSSAASLERKQRFVQEVTIQYNLCNEPWLKYSMGTVADRGLKRHQWTSSRLKKETMYLESTSIRYELCWDHSVPDNSEDKDFYRWAICKKPLAIQDLRDKGIPLPVGELQDVFGDLAWEDLKWAPTGVEICGKKYHIIRIQFLPRSRSAEDNGEVE